MIALTETRCYAEGEPHHQRIRDTEEIAWLTKYARGVDWKAPDRADDDRPATKTTEP